MLFVEILSNIGGISKSLIFLFGLLGIANNERKVIGKSIRNLYFVSDKNNENKENSEKSKNSTFQFINRDSGVSI